MLHSPLCFDRLGDYTTLIKLFWNHQTMAKGKKPSTKLSYECHLGMLDIKKLHPRGICCTTSDSCGSTSAAPMVKVKPSVPEDGSRSGPEKHVWQTHCLYIFTVINIDQSTQDQGQTIQQSILKVSVA